jgi:hypothetical protein
MNNPSDLLRDDSTAKLQLIPDPKDFLMIGHELNSRGIEHVDSSFFDCKFHLPGLS